MTLPPLLALAGGHKVRPRQLKIPVPRESSLHAQVATLLMDHALPDWRWTFLNRKAKDAREGAIFKRMGLKPHWPDFIFISPYGSIRCLEVKRAGEKPTKGQIEFRLWCIQHGIPHVVAWTMDDVGAACDEWGCLRIKFAGARP